MKDPIPPGWTAVREFYYGCQGPHSSSHLRFVGCDAQQTVVGMSDSASVLLSWAEITRYRGHHRTWKLGQGVVVVVVVGTEESPLSPDKPEFHLSTNMPESALRHLALGGEEWWGAQGQLSSTRLGLSIMLMRQPHEWASVLVHVLFSVAIVRSDWQGLCW